MTAPLSTAIPIVSGPSVPASVRDGSPAARNAYETALDFEQMLVGQLSKGMIEDSGLGGEGEGEAAGEAGASGQAGSAGSGLLSALGPQALSEGITRGGGLGLATQLMSALDPAATSAAAAAGGSPATSAATTGGAEPSPATVLAATATVGGSAPSTASTAVAATGTQQTAGAAGPTGGVSA
jgi:Rod binding domain-containing protein